PLSGLAAIQRFLWLRAGAGHPRLDSALLRDSARAELADRQQLMETAREPKAQMREPQARVREPSSRKHLPPKAQAARVSHGRAGIRGFVGLAPLLAACLWGGMYVVSRASFDAIPPITLGLLRVIIGGLTLWLALRLTARRGIPSAAAERASTRGDQWRFLLLGGTLAATIITQFWGTA